MTQPTLRTTTTNSRYNDDLLVNKDQRKILIENIKQFHYKNFQDHRISGYCNDFETRFFAPDLRSSLLYIITETVGDYPYPYLTEKTWKAMITGAPFMIVGARGSLKLLQSFGFKTFDKWWDESYDSLPIVADRIDKIVSELERLHALSLDSLSEIKKEMLPILEHNQSHMLHFRKEDLANIRNNL
jgi:hypothetical protein